MRPALITVVLALLVTLASAQTQTQPQTQPTPPTKQTVAQKIAASQQLLDLNTATPAQLKALPGIGDVYVKRIIDGRPYTAKNQLVTRGILPQSTYNGIKEQVIAHRPRQ